MSMKTPETTSNRITVHHCQICDEPTVLNRLGDGSVVCSCPSQRLFELIEVAGNGEEWRPVAGPDA